MRQNSTQKKSLFSHISIGFPCKQLLNEYLITLPLETLQHYPQTGWHWWMGKNHVPHKPWSCATTFYIGDIFRWAFEQNIPRNICKLSP